MAEYAFLFPGQASQFIGMGRQLCAAHEEARRMFAQADEILDMPLTQLCFEGPEDELRQTRVTQPAVFVHSMAAWRVLVSGGLAPTAVAGHSLGEYAALVAAGAMDFVTALRLVQRRAQLMQNAGRGRPGTMAAVLGLDDSTVVELCAQARDRGVVVPANFNAPGQVVVSGDEAAVRRLEELAHAAGAKRVIQLAVSGAFHSPLMESAARELGELLGQVEVRPAQVPVVANVTAQPTTDPDELRANLIRQMTHPVRWVEIVRRLVDMGVQVAVEVGPGSVLKGLVRRIERTLAVYPAATAQEIDAATQAVV